MSLQPSSKFNLINASPVTNQEIETHPVYKKLQGNILKGHGRDFSTNIFLEFRISDNGSKSVSKVKLRSAIATLAEKYVTSAFTQYLESKQYNQFRIPGSLFGNFFVSATGYKKLGQDVKGFKDKDTVPIGAENFFVKADSFINGMKATAEDLGDLPKGLDSIDPETIDFRLSPLQKKHLEEKGRIKEKVNLEPLEEAYQAGTIDGMLLLADDDENGLLKETRKVITELEQKGILRVVAVERGTALRNNEGEGIEHFGYVDGRSQPLYLVSDFAHLTLKNGAIDVSLTKERVNDKAAKREGADINIWNPFAKLNLVLKKDPAIADADAFGSYFVFRKLEQDVLRFSIAEQQLADALKLQGQDRERAGAMIVGRFRDGTPLILSEADGFVPAKENNFRYDDQQAIGGVNPLGKDTLGLKCPFQAHIRKTNPRESTDSASEEGDLRRRITRRGITYGNRNKHPNAFQTLDELPTGDVGLLFACFQSSIVSQYAFMQRTWADNTSFKQPGAGIDPLIGQPFDMEEASRPQQSWRKQYGAALVEVLPAAVDLESTHKTKKRIDNFIQFRGGEFFFAPSIPFLLNNGDKS